VLQTTIISRLVGTSGYQSPEFLRARLATTKCDVYAFAILMWTAVAKETPFAGLHQHTVIFKVSEKKKVSCTSNNK
jgi:proto-oncogene serine/threonine-protein kinase mos